jgi:uncharacterized protein (UPF0335 family)
MSEIKLKQEVIDSIQERIDKECYFVGEEWVISSDETLEIVADVLQKTMERIIERLDKEGQEIYREVKEAPLSPFVPTGEKEILVRNAIRIVKEEGGIE